MLKELHIKNLKSHKNSVLLFSKGLNLICGTTQAGKSACLSAFLKLVENRPTGADFYSSFAPDNGKVRIKGVFYDGHSVEQVVDVVRKDNECRAKSVKYFIDGKLAAKKIGTKVPDRVSNLINLGDVNYQKQSDSSFLISDSATSFSKAINSLTGTDEVNFCLSEINSRLESNNRDIKQKKSKIKKIKNKLKKLKKLDLLFVSIRSAHYYDVRFEKKFEEINNIEYFFEIWKRIELKLRPMKIKHRKLGLVLKEIEDNIKKIGDETKVLNAFSDFLKIKKRLDNYRLKRDRILDELLSMFRGLKICPYCFSKIGANGMQQIEKGMKNV